MRRRVLASRAARGERRRKFASRPSRLGRRVLLRLLGRRVLARCLSDLALQRPPILAQDPASPAHAPSSPREPDSAGLRSAPCCRSLQRTLSAWAARRSVQLSLVIDWSVNIQTWPRGEIIELANPSRPDARCTSEWFRGEGP